MSERHKTHHGRDLSGHHKVRQEDVEDLLEDPQGTDYVQDDVRLGGAVADTGPAAGLSGEHIGEVIEQNRDDVAKVTGRTSKDRRRER